MQVGGDANDFLVVLQAEAIEPVIKGESRAMNTPTMDGRNQPHRPKSTQEEPEHVGLVVVAVPNLHALAAAQIQQTNHDHSVERATVVDLNQANVAFLSLAAKTL